MDKEYKINIDPRILELLGPHLYTNIYYVLAELIANSYDAGAHNVYVIQQDDAIFVEDDGSGMSYEEGDIEKYLGVAVETRTNEKESYVEGTERKKIGRKGIGKLAALSVSENVLVMTVKNGEKSGFVLSRKVGKDSKLIPIQEKEISFKMINPKKSGTSIVMTNPQYTLPNTANAIKKNLLKMFPLVNKDFKIHIITKKDKLSLENFDKEMIGELGTLIIFGKEYQSLSNFFIPGLNNDSEAKKLLLKQEKSICFPIKMKNKLGKEKTYNLEIKGWLGAYRSTKDKKINSNDFPDNFISLLSNGKLGEYNILPLIGKNRLIEVFVVGQLYVDLFEETELQDMSLSNRQGYKTDDPRYKLVISHVEKDLLPRVINMRQAFVSYRDKEKSLEKDEKQKAGEKELKDKVEAYKKSISQIVTERISEKLEGESPAELKKFIEGEMDKSLPLMGLKSKVDSKKKKVLISHVGVDKILADVVYKMLSFNGISDEDIIYTHCDNEGCWIPHGKEVWEYLRDFFVNSISDEKIYVIYITSKDMAQSWYAVSEVGAGWITKSKHDIFNIEGYTPLAPLNVGLEWHTSKKSDDNILMNQLSFNKFVTKVMAICKDLGYSKKTNAQNERELSRYVSIEN